MERFFISGCVLHRNLRFTCYAHEAMREDGQLNGIEFSAKDALTVRAHSHAKVSPLCETGLTAWFHQDGASAGMMDLIQW